MSKYYAILGTYIDETAGSQPVTSILGYFSKDGALLGLIYLRMFFLNTFVVQKKPTKWLSGIADANLKLSERTHKGMLTLCKCASAPASSSEGESQASSYALKGTEALEPAHPSGLIASLLFHPWNFTLFYKLEHARLFCPCAIAHVNLPLTHQENSYPSLKSCVAIT